MKIKGEDYSWVQVIFLAASVVRGIITYPVIWILGLLGVPNFRFTYKSGKREYWFFKRLNIKRTGSEITGLEWVMFTARSQPFHVNVDEIESITQLW